MTEEEARQVVLLQSHEATGTSAIWTAEDRLWATQQAVASLGEKAAPDRFVATRAGFALQRLLPRDGKAKRWLAQRAWHPAWMALAGVVGFASGLIVDQLGPPD